MSKLPRGRIPPDVIHEGVCQGCKDDNVKLFLVSPDVYRCGRCSGRTTRAEEHYTEQAKLALFDELVTALTRLTESHDRLEMERGSVVGTLTLNARAVLAKIPQPTPPGTYAPGKATRIDIEEK